MKSSTLFLPIILFTCLFLRQDTFSQSKFEIGANIDPLVVPVNFGTYVEDGPGYYDINGRGKITQSASAYFTYWPHTSFGISVGIGVRNFSSQIDYIIPDPFDDSMDPIMEGSFPFTAKGLGPSLSVLFRKEKWRARIGLSTVELYDQEYISNFSNSGYGWSSGGEAIASLYVEEYAYWHTVPDAYAFLHFEGQYNIFDRVYIKCGFETTVSGPHPYPFKLSISGFTPDTGPPEQLLNDYMMRNTLSSFSFGVGYTFGFGKYNRPPKENKM